jgi:hypothetical protein
MTRLPIVFLPVLMGFFIVRALASGLHGCCRHDLFRMIFGASIGIGLASECYFTGLFCGASGLWFEILLLVAAAIALGLNRKATCCFCDFADSSSGDSDLVRYLGSFFAMLMVVDLIVFSIVSARTPHGGWDAWAIWNLRARFFFRDGGLAWRDGFTEALAWSHPDYPLMLPAFVAGTWKLLGRETSAVPIGVACFFTFGCAALMATSVAILRDVRQGLLAGLAIAATPFIYVQGAMQCADVPVAFFRLASLAAFAMADRFEHCGFAVLAGVAAALGGWTKNEGLLWLGALVAARAIFKRGVLFLAFLAGAAPVTAVVIVFKARVATSSDIFGAAGRAGMLTRVVDPARYLLIVKEALRHIWDFGPLLISAFGLLAVYFIVAGLARDPRDTAALRSGVLAILFTAAGYFMIYVLRPLDLAWLLDTSADRLLLQLWPAIVFEVFLAARAPQRVCAFRNLQADFRQPLA